MTLNYVESSDLAVNRWHLPNDVDLRHKALCAKKVNDVNLRQTAPDVLSSKVGVRCNINFINLIVQQIHFLVSRTTALRCELTKSIYQWVKTKSSFLHTITF